LEKTSLNELKQNKNKKRSIYHKISAFDIGDAEWIDAESPMVLERNEKTVKKIIKQMGF
jgi:hypothetical protein